MTDPNQAEGKSVEERIEAATTTQPKTDTAVAEKPQEAVPTPDQKPTEEATEEVVDPNEEERLALENAKNPERTKAYIEKLKAENLKLKAKEPQPEKEDYGTSVFDSLIPKAGVQQQGQAQQAPQAPSATDFQFLNQQQVNNILANYVTTDPQTGEQTVDVNGLNYALFQANEESRLARQHVQRVEGELRSTQEHIARMEESQQLKELYQEFPELDPLKTDQFDKKLFKHVKRALLENKAARKNVSVVDVARDVKQELYTPEPVDKAKIEEEVVSNLKKKQEARNQGPMETGRGVDRTSEYDKEDVHKRIREGDWAALDEALKEVGV